MEEIKRSRIALGLMRLKDVSVDQLETIVRTCLDKGITSYDISDIYCRHDSEKKLGEILKVHPELRQRMFLQTKCGIVKDDDVPPYYDLSYKHIMEAVDASLERLGTTYLDSLLLHRPDIFMDSKEVTRAFMELKAAGKVLHFGISNADVGQMSYLRRESNYLEIAQLQLGLGQPALLASTFNVNNPHQEHLNTDGIFYYLKEKGMTLQCWSPYQLGFFQGIIFNNPKLPELNAMLQKLSQKYHSTPCGIATAFLTDLGDFVEVITGSMNLAHIQESLDGAAVVLEKPDWYALYAATGNLLP